MTPQDVIDAARLTLNDDDKTLYPDADLLEYVNDGLDDLFDLRPDLFLNHIAVMAEGASYAIGAALPLPGRWRRTLADYVIFRAESAEDEHVNSGRAQVMADFWKGKVR